GDAARLSRFGDGRNGRGAADVGRSSNDAGRPEISSAGQVRHAGLAGGRAGVTAKRRRSDYFDRNRFCRATIPRFARLGGAYWKERCLTRHWVRNQKVETEDCIGEKYARLLSFNRAA